jgi:outer membrane PBP1 activator LpoA protein
MTLAACTTPPPRPLPAEPGQPLPPVVGQALPRYSAAWADQFLAVEEHLARNDWMSASRALDELALQDMGKRDAVQIAYLYARILYTRGDVEGARLGLQRLRQAPLDADLHFQVVSRLRQFLAAAGEDLESASLGDQLLAGLPPEADSTGLLHSIWHDLLSVPAVALQASGDISGTGNWAGWQSLAALATNPALDTPSLISALETWQIDHPGHPASGQLPGGLDRLAGQLPVDRVTLILPLSGRLAPAAKAVRDGYLASYYRERSRGGGAWELEILDSGDFDSVASAYQQAVLGGSKLVLGPLSKNEVAALSRLPDRRVPVLALNRIDQPVDQGSVALVQLALAPEDEAAQLARLAYGLGHRKALVIRPAGAWGDKMEGVLAQTWGALGGQLSATAVYSGQEDYSASIKQALAIRDSEERARRIRALFDTEVEFNARRRADLDVVFLLSRSAREARSIKPLLAFHYAADLPVMATSNVYRGVADVRDRDLEGIEFLEIPWLLGLDEELRQTILASPIVPANFTRLHALGADAYLLQSRFIQLEAGPQALVRGHSGLLSLNPALQIERELVRATFDDGGVKPLQ